MELERKNSFNTRPPSKKKIYFSLYKEALAEARASAAKAEALALVDAAQAEVFLAYLASEVMYSSGNLQPVKCYELIIAR